MKSLAFALLLVSGSMTAASRLVEVGPLPRTTTYPTTEIQFLNRLDGWASNPEGLWRTQDGGASWIGVALPQPNLRNLRFDSVDVGWAVMASDEVSRGHLYRTQNDGKTWQMQPDLPEAADALHFTPGGSVGWAGGDKLSDPPPPLTILPGCLDPPDKTLLEPEIFHTTDSGRHWIKQSLPELGGCPVGGLSFRNEREGVAVSGSHLYYTLDGGNTWVSATFSRDCSPDLLLGEQDQQVSFFYDAKIGWLGSSYGSLLKTVDGGKTWCGLRRPEQGFRGLGHFGAVFFDSPQHGWILGSEMNVYETTDGGSSWSKVPGPEHIYELNCRDDRCWAISNGMLYRIEPQDR